MKGLLLKDLYMTAKYCRAYLLLAVVFCAISFSDRDNLFLLFYPCLLCGMIPVNLLSYDERSRWLQYSETLPCTRAQIVSGKYLIGLFAQAAMLCLTGIAQAVRMIMDGQFRFGEYLVMIILMLVLSLIGSSISLPFIFKLGVEKGRMAYYVMVGVVSGGSVAAASLLSDGLSAEIGTLTVLPMLCLGIGLYALSWYLSIVFYRRREL
ncbi:MAG: ABC-2 transporter permease [Clostridia bacterium]|nr:ABC-2 transporter permease [Clostridia bacterium]